MLEKLKPICTLLPSHNRQLKESAGYKDIATALGIDVYFVHSLVFWGNERMKI